jgi:hypothetical protein
MPRRKIRDGETYTTDEDVELEEVERRPEPSVEIQGEPWGWTKAGDRPKGWPGPEANRDNPGPYDGEWEPRDRLNGCA